MMFSNKEKSFQVQDLKVNSVQEAQENYDMQSTVMAWLFEVQIIIYKGGTVVSKFNIIQEGSTLWLTFGLDHICLKYKNIYLSCSNMCNDDDKIAHTKILSITKTNV